MTDQHRDKNLAQIQFAADQLIESQSEGRPSAFEQLAQTILEHFDHRCESTATSELFSIEFAQEHTAFRGSMAPPIPR